MTLRPATALETVFVDALPLDATDAFEAAFSEVCGTVGIFLDEATETWCVEGVKDQGSGEAELASGLALARLVTGIDAPLQRHGTESEGWLARTRSAFPEQFVGRRFAIRGTHLPPHRAPGRHLIWLDAGVAFGSGEHGSTRGCLRALEKIAYRRPKRVIDVGTGSGILALAAASLLHANVLATDFDPWSVRVLGENARLNHLHRQVNGALADGWNGNAIRATAPYDLVFANILARPLCRMARDLAANLAPGGTAILAGLLTTQAAMVLSAHRRQGLVLESRLVEGAWTTLILRRRR